MTLEIISELPAGPPSGPPLLFVHGAWHAAWCWRRHFLPFFARHGYPAYALSLRGHGGSPAARPLRWTSVAEYVDDVTAAAAGLPAAPVLIGHSLGGFVLHHYLKSHAAAGAAFLASVPPRGAWGATWRVARRHPLIFLRANLTMSLYPLVATVGRAKELLFSDAMPDEQAAEYQKLLQDESYRSYLDMLFRPVHGRGPAGLPALVVGGADDFLIDDSDVRATARHYACEPRILPGLAHDVMLDPRWQDAAEIILQWLRATAPHRYDGGNAELPGRRGRDQGHTPD